MNEKVNALNWFEISVSDITRATKFYETVFNVKLEQMEIMDMKMAMFPAENMNGKVSGSLVQGSMHKPSAEGVLIYLNGNPDLAVALGKVENAGGKVVMPKMNISPEIGNMAFFIDTEGNKIGLHSNN